ncbi:MAG TPA: membrane dipeptidase, partial [Acidobacteriota bacterium]|nr:membrane dipeptidase [Acidobacteriota bacterium]
KPMIASHSSVRSICNHQRNMTDEMIRALAKKGGVVFINFYPAFISQSFREKYEMLFKRLEKQILKVSDRYKEKPELAGYEQDQMLQSKSSTLPRVNMDDVIQHIEHVINIAGVESVGLGSDFDGTPFMPEGLQDCTGLPRLCDELRKRKFKPSEIDKIASGNFLRVFSEIVG